MKVLISNKLIIVLCFVMLNVFAASSQLRFGIKGGVDVSNNHLNKNILNASNRLGFQLGATVEAKIPIVGLGLELSALYGQQKYDNEFSDESGNNYKLSDYNYVSVPLNLKYKFSIVGLVGAFVAVGPYIQFKVDGGDLERESGNISDQWEAKSYGAGLNAGAGVELFHHFELGMYYRKSLTDNYAENSGAENIIKNRPDNWTVSATYFF